MKILKLCLTFLLPALVLLGAFQVAKRVKALRPQALKRPPEQIVYTVETALPSPQTRRVSLTGQGLLKPLISSVVSAQVGGTIIWIHPRLFLGQHFEGKEVLVKLDPTNYQLALAQAEEVRTSSEIAFEEEKAKASLAHEQLKSMGMEKDMQPLAGRSLHLKHARQRLEKAKYAVLQAKRDLAATEVVAPLSGRLLSESVTIGQYKNMGSALFTLYETDTLYIPLPLRPAELETLGIALDFGFKGQERGLLSEVSFFNLKGETLFFPARLKRVEAVADPNTLLLHGIVELSAKQGNLYLPLGLMVHVKVFGKELKDILVVPRGVLVGEKVWVLDGDNRLYLRAAEVLHFEGDQAFVQVKLQAQDRIVLTPLRAVPEGNYGRSLSQRP